MPFYLLQEDGSHFLLEDLSGAIILEETGLSPTVWHQGGAGYPAPHGRKRRRRTYELFHALETTLREVVAGTHDPVVPVVVGRTQWVYQPDRKDEDRDLTLRQLRSLAAGYRALLTQITHLDQDLRAWGLTRETARREQEEEELVIWLL